MEVILPGLEEEGVGFKGPATVGSTDDRRGTRQGGPELWAKLDAIEVAAPLDYPEQPIIRELDFGL